LNVTIGPDVPPGEYNLVLHSQTQFPYNKDPMSKARPNTPGAALQRGQVDGAAESLVTLTPATLKRDGQGRRPTEVTVRVTRRFNYDGELKVQLMLPRAPRAWRRGGHHPAGQNETKLVVRAPAGTPAGPRNNSSSASSPRSRACRCRTRPGSMSTF